MFTLQESHRISPPHGPSSKNAVGTKQFAGHAPETFSKNTSCRFLKNMHARGVLWEGFVFFDGDLTCEPFRLHHIFWRGVNALTNVVGFLWGKHWLEQGFYHSLTAFELRSDNTPTQSVVRYQWKSLSLLKVSELSVEVMPLTEEIRHGIFGWIHRQGISEYTFG